jgi:hypothetical protein
MLFRRNQRRCLSEPPGWELVRERVLRRELLYESVCVACARTAAMVRAL